MTSFSLRSGLALLGGFAGGEVTADQRDPAANPTILTGDLNCDDLVNNLDIDAFVLALSDPAGYAAAYPDCDPAQADVNADGVVNNFDIDPFVRLIRGG